MRFRHVRSREVRRGPVMVRPGLWRRASHGSGVQIRLRKSVNASAMNRTRDPIHFRGGGVPSACLAPRAGPCPAKAWNRRRMPVRHIAIIGSGPAGYYTAEAAQKAFEDDVRVDVFDLLPVRIRP